MKKNWTCSAADCIFKIARLLCRYPGNTGPLYPHHTTDNLLCCDDGKKLGSNLIIRLICVNNFFTLTPLVFTKHAAFSLTKHELMDWSGVDYCDVFISCLDSHSDGTHSLQKIYWWASDVMLNISKYVLMKKQTHLLLEWPEFLGWSIPLRNKVNKLSKFIPVLHKASVQCFLGVLHHNKLIDHLHW